MFKIRIPDETPHGDLYRVRDRWCFRARVLVGVGGQTTPYYCTLAYRRTSVVPMVVENVIPVT